MRLSLKSGGMSVSSLEGSEVVVLPEFARNHE